MTLRRLDETTIALEGICSIDDAEPLLERLINEPYLRVDWRSCEQAHAALVQILLVARPALLGPPCGSFLQNFVAPAMARAQARESPLPPGA
jgi:hypothetical protein